MAIAPQQAPGAASGDELAVTRALLFVAMAVWGLNLSAVKTLTQWFDVALLSLLRMAIAGVLLLGLLAWRRQRLPHWCGRQWVLITGCAALMVYGNQLLLAGGLQRTTAANGAIMMALSPLVAMLLAAVFFREALTRN